MVEESVGGRLVLNQPAGHLEPDESLVEAALRETREETGWDVRLTAFVGAYQWKAPLQADGSGGRHYLRFAFAAEPVSHDPLLRLDEGIVRALWLSPPSSRPSRRAIAARWSGRPPPISWPAGAIRWISCSTWHEHRGQTPSGPSSGSPAGSTPRWRRC